MSILKYKGIAFDDYAQNEDGTYWAEICQKCFENHYDILCYDAEEGGGNGVTCFVKGCFCSDDNEKHYYIDFDPEYVSFEEVSESDDYDEQYI